MKKKYIILAVFIVVFILALIMLFAKNNKSITTSSQAINTNKIEWGIKREDNHKQPDLGRKNKEVLEKYKGIAMGNPEKKKIYLTFDEGYEAGYTEKILEVLKQNNVKATFFITAHYLNTQEELVKQMIEQGHIVGNHIPVI